MTAQHQYGNLNENSILEYARSHKFEEATVGLSLLCSLPVDVVERALADSSNEMIMILAKALNFEWETTMSLLFLGAKDHRISARDLDHMRDEFARLNTETSRTVLSFYKSRKTASTAAAGTSRHWVTAPMACSMLDCSAASAPTNAAVHAGASLASSDSACRNISTI